MATKSIALKLPLTENERVRLRQQKIRIDQIPDMQPEQLSLLIDVPIDRAVELTALGTFQRIPDIGPVMAQCLVRLGYSRVSQLHGKNPVGLLDDLEVSLGYWVDPCVEDELRLVVHYAEHPETDKRWWDFTGERKAYRAKHGYPATRPTMSWNDSTRQGGR
jgi:hypothetical protein